MNTLAGRSCVRDGWAAGRADGRIGRWHLLLSTQYFHDRPAWEFPTVMAGWAEQGGTAAL
jgi:hypothetical protein